MRSRRSLLRTGGLAAVGTLGGIVALPSPPDGTPIDRTVEATDLPTRLAEWADEEGPITDETATPIARYQYRATGSDPDRGDRDAFVATAPINVVLVPDPDTETDAAGLERVTEVLEDEGWHRRPDEYTRFAWDRIDERFVRQQATAAESYYGASDRFHVRCWSFEGVVSMQAHEDAGARPKHDIASYRRGHEVIAAVFDAADWYVSADGIDLDNGQRDYDGLATVITESEPAHQ